MSTLRFKVPYHRAIARDIKFKLTWQSEYIMRNVYFQLFENFPDWESNTAR